MVIVTTPFIPCLIMLHVVSTHNMRWTMHIQALFVIPRWPPNEMQVNQCVQGTAVVAILLYYS